MNPSPPAPFPKINRRRIDKGTELHRVHDGRYRPNTFNPCIGRPTRFAPLRRPDGSCVDTSYAAASFECATHETIFHEIQHAAPRKTIDFDVIEGLHYSVVIPSRALIMATLFEPDLNRWGITRRDLIDTYPTAYARTALWALAIHDAHRDIDGLEWTSKRCDPVSAYLFFGDRVGKHGLDIRSEEPIARSNHLVAAIHAFGERAGITLVF